jgi:integrase
MLLVEAPRIEKRLMPAITEQQVECLMNSADTVRDKCIVSLLADSSMRLNELANIKATDIDWDTCTIMIWGKGKKQRKAPFAGETASLLKAPVAGNGTSTSIWGINKFGIQKLFKRLREATGILCNFTALDAASPVTCIEKVFPLLISCTLVAGLT